MDIERPRPVMDSEKYFRSNSISTKCDESEGDESESFRFQPINLSKVYDEASTNDKQQQVLIIIVQIIMQL